MEDPHFLCENGQQRLEEEIRNATSIDPIISKLHDCDNFDFSPYFCLYPLMEMMNNDLTPILHQFISKQNQLLIEKVQTISESQLPSFLKAIQPYALIPQFRNIIEILVEKFKPLPEWFILPPDIQISFTPQERLNLFHQRPSDYKKWLSHSFEDSLCDFAESDDFQYLQLFKSISQYCFSYIELHDITVKYCEENFLSSYHPIYSVIRFRLALFNSPLAEVDHARPLATFVLDAIRSPNKKLNYKQMQYASEICPKISQIIFSVPQFLLKYPPKDYLRSFGVDDNLRNKWTPYLNEGNDDACDYMTGKNSHSRLFARVIALNLIHDFLPHPRLFKTLESCIPQVDVNYILCRMKYKVEYEPLLKKWAESNGSCLIDYVTSCFARRMPIPEFPIRPSLTPQQQAIFDYAMSKQT